MKILPLLTLTTACVLTCFAQTYNIQLYKLDWGFINREAFPQPESHGQKDAPKDTPQALDHLKPQGASLQVSPTNASIYDGMKPAELTEPFIGSRHQKAYQQALKDDPQKVGILIKLSVVPSKTDPNSVTVTAEYFEKSLHYFSEDKGKMKAHFRTIQWASSQEVAQGKPTLIYSSSETCRVIDRTPFWGDIPLIGRLFQKPGTSTSVHEYFVTASLLPEKKS